MEAVARARARVDEARVAVVSTEVIVPTGNGAEAAENSDDDSPDEPEPKTPD